MEQTDRIAQLETIINDYNKEQKALEKKIEKSRKKIEEHNKKIWEIEDLKSPYFKELYDLKIGEWTERGKQGLNKSIKYSDIPPCIKSIKTEIFQKISGGCTGDWYDGCRGCTIN